MPIKVECCGLGDYTCQVSMPIAGRLVSVDFCIHDVVAALNAANIRTAASCCGHGKADAHILLETGQEIVIKRPVKVRDGGCLSLRLNRSIRQKIRKL